MRISLPLSVVCSMAFLTFAMPLRAQSLGDLARKEAERRKTLPDTGKVLTNKDVPLVAQPDEPPVSDATEPVPAAASSEAKDKKAAAAEAEETKDEKYWGDRQKALQTQLDQDVFMAQAVQSRINGLTADFVNRDDPAQRALIATDRQKAIDEAARLSDAIERDKQNIANFEEEARRANVPEGWLR